MEKHCKGCQIAESLSPPLFYKLNEFQEMNCRISVEFCTKHCWRGLRSKEGIEIMKWNTSNFEGLVLGCIDSYDSEKRRIFQNFSSSTRFLCLRTANTSKFQQKTVKLFGRNEMKFHFIPILVNEFGHFSAKFWWNFVRISRIFSEKKEKKFSEILNDEMSRDSHK